MTDALQYRPRACRSPESRGHWSLAIAMPVKLPDRLRCFPEDERFASLPVIWHVSGRLIPAGMRRFLRPWWSWWVSRWLESIMAASEARKERERPDFV